MKGSYEFFCSCVFHKPRAMTRTSRAADGNPWKGDSGQVSFSFLGRESESRVRALHPHLCCILTPGVPFSIKHSESLTRIGQTSKQKT